MNSSADSSIRRPVALFINQYTRVSYHTIPGNWNIQPDGGGAAYEEGPQSVLKPDEISMVLRSHCRAGSMAHRTPYIRTFADGNAYGEAGK